jgi:hypothetical protein
MFVADRFLFTPVNLEAQSFIINSIELEEIL